ncbi:MAG TPA: hypothetical protein VKT77_00375 [Chthonomonadaceae bacterium]|nr:hypothetical protein [Chthonomonadaceae bacterium]
MSSAALLPAARQPQRRQAHWVYTICLIAIALLSCLINAGGISHSEVIDDHDLLHNASARGCGRNPLDCFRHPQFGLYYRPLFGASFSVGENLHGQDPLGFHIENLILHAIVMLEAGWAFRLILRRDRVALLALLLYGVHPIQVTVTTFIGGRTDSLALAFAFWFVIGAIKSAEGRQAPLWRLAAFLGYAGAVFSKEQTAPLLLLLPLVAGAPRLRTMAAEPARAAASIAWMAPFLLPALGLLLAARAVIPADAIDTVAWTATATQVGWSLPLRIEMVGRTLWYYFNCYFAPTIATIHRSSLGAWDVAQPGVALGGLFIAAVWVAVTIRSWRVRGPRILALWFGVTILPCVNIVPIPSQFASCYRTAIPLFGLCGVFAWFADRMLVRLTRRFGVLVAWFVPTAIAAALAMMAAADVPIWNSDLTVTDAEYRADPNFLPALAGYGISLRKVGRLKEALAVDDRVVRRLFPRQNTVQERITAMDTPWMLRSVKSQASLRYQPRIFADWVMRERGGCLQDLGFCVPAIDDYRVALAALPSDTGVADALAVCLERSGRYEEERALLETTVRSYPSSERLRWLGVTYMHLGDWANAKETLAKSLAMAVHEKSPNAKTILTLYLKAEARSKRR